MTEIKEKEKEIMKIENYPEWADNIDRAIMDTIIESPKSCSHNTFINRFKEKIKLMDRINKITKETGLGIKKWEQNKPTLQIGTEKQYQKAMKEEEKEKEKEDDSR